MSGYLALLRAFEAEAKHGKVWYACMRLYVWLEDKSRAMVHGVDKNFIGICWLVA